MKKRYFKINDFSRNALMLGAAAFLGLTTSCGSGSSEEKQGVITVMTESEGGEWKVTDERYTIDGKNMAILNHLDGRTDTIQGKALEDGLRQQAQVQQQGGGGMFGGMGGIWTILMLSQMGNMMGFRSQPNPAAYANRGVYEKSQTMYRQTAPRSGRTGFFRNSGSSSSRGTSGFGA